MPDEREATCTRVKFVRRLPGAPPDPLPAGSTATRARVAKLKDNYENEKQI